MARYLIEIDTSNDAFEDLEFELGRILRAAARKVEFGELDFKLRDSNGNTVGSAHLEDDEPDDLEDGTSDEDDEEEEEDYGV